MGLKLLGALDVLAGITIALLIFGIESKFVLIFACYLFVKALFLFGGVSLVDLIVAVLMVYAYLNSLPTLVLSIMTFWLLQKGFISMFT
ncbi:MAG: hypothetical protein Q8R00_03765 [Candidatus Nanoarchaeia archaeon]|nr:hypothetical protein [Candidatus Nanoarchaeia archaeon]